MNGANKTQVSERVEAEFILTTVLPDLVFIDEIVDYGEYFAAEEARWALQPD